MAILSSAKNAIKKAASKVSSTVSNASKQLQALGSSINKPKTVAPGPMTKAPVQSAPMTKYNPGGYPQSTTAALQAGSKSSNTPSNTPYTSYSSNGAPMSTSKAVQASASKPRSTSSGGSNMASAYTALQSMFGGGAGSQFGAEASDGGPGVDGGSSYAPQMSTYRGSTGVNTTSYTPGQTQSLEARATQPAPVITAGARQQNQGLVSGWDNSAADRQSQVTALQGQLAALQAARDATAPAAIDPLQQRLDTEAQDLETEEERIQKEIRKLTEPSAEYMQAKEQEDELNAKEAAIKAGVSRSTAEISSQPIPYGFVTGQSAAVERRANADLETIAAQKIPLQQRLANEQARRAAALDVVKSSASRIYSKSDRASDRSYDYLGETRKNKRDDDKTAYERQQDEKRFQEDVRQFGVTEARLRQNAANEGGSGDSNAGSALDQARGSDGYTDPNLYASLRAQSKSAAEFDRKFGYLVNPLSKARLGLGESGA